MAGCVREGEMERGIVVFPNPAENVVNVVLKPRGFLKPSGFTMEAFDILGQEVYSWKGGDEFETIHPIDVSGWASGQYVLKVKFGDDIFTEKIMVMGNE